MLERAEGENERDYESVEESGRKWEREIKCCSELRTMLECAGVKSHRGLPELSFDLKQWAGESKEGPA